MKPNSLAGAALVALLSPNCNGFNLAPKPRVAPFSTRSPNRKFLTSYNSPNQIKHVSTLYSTVSNEKESVDKTKTVAFDPADEFTGDAPSKILGGKIPYSELTIGVLKETYPGENRVSVAPESAKSLVDAGFSVVVESGGECIVLLLGLKFDMQSHLIHYSCCFFQLESMLLSVMVPTLKLDVLFYPVTLSTLKPIS